MRLSVWFVLLLVGCPAPRVPAHPADATDPAAIKATTCGDVTALWKGTTPDGSGPLWFFVQSLSFRFSDGTEKAFLPKGDVEAPHTSFELFSPDCRTVALAQSSYGPYHLVPVAKLAAYLDGKFEPTIVTPPASRTQPILTDQKWVSPTKLEFFASCCGGVEVYQADVAAPNEPQRVYFAPEAPAGIRRTERGFEKVSP